MWTVFGDITNDPQYYEYILKLSNWRFSPAHVALGKYTFDKGNFEQAAYHLKSTTYQTSFTSYLIPVRGNSVRLSHWKRALQGFSWVV